MRLEKHKDEPTFEEHRQDFLAGKPVPFTFSGSPKGDVLIVLQQVPESQKVSRLHVTIGVDPKLDQNQIGELLKECGGQTQIVRAALENIKVDPSSIIKNSGVLETGWYADDGKGALKDHSKK